MGKLTKVVRIHLKGGGLIILDVLVYRILHWLEL